MIKLFFGFLITLLVSKEIYCWNPLSQDPWILALNVVVLAGIVGLLIYIKRRERQDE